MSYAAPNAEGNLLVAIVSSFSGGISPSAITDSRGNIWKLAGTISENSAFFYVPSCAAGPNTITFNNIADRVVVALAEYSGQATSGVVLDAVTFPLGPNVGMGQSTSIFTQNPNSLVIASFHGIAQDNVWAVTGTGFTTQGGGGSQLAQWADNTTSTGGGFNTAAATVGTRDGLVARAIAFLPVGLTAPTTTTFVRTSESPVKNLLPPGAGIVTNTFWGGNTGGDTILVVTNEFDTTRSLVTGISDTAGNTYTLLDEVNWPVLFEAVNVFICNGCKATTSPNVISVSFAAEADSIDMFAVEISGKVTLDMTASATNTTTDSVSYTINCAKPNEFIYTYGVAVGTGTNSSFGNQIDLAAPLLGPSIHSGETVVAVLPPGFAVQGTNTITQTWTRTDVASKSFAFQPLE